MAHGMLLEITNNITLGSIATTTVAVVGFDNGDVPMLCGILVCRAGSDPTATVSATITLGQFSITLPTQTLSSTSTTPFTIHDVLDETIVNIQYATTVTGTSGNYSIFFKMKQ